MRLLDKTIAACNRCRMYLQVITLSDMCDALGTKMNHNAIKCTGPTHSYLQLPNQEHLSPSDRRI